MVNRIAKSRFTGRLLVAASLYLAAQACAQEFESAGDAVAVHDLQFDAARPQIVELIQLGRSLRIEVVDPVGHALAILDHPGRTIGTKLFLLEDLPGGMYQIRVMPNRPSSAKGGFRLTLRGVPDDPALVVQLRELTRAAALYSSTDSGARQAALQSYSVAARQAGPLRGWASQYYASAESEYGNRALADRILWELPASAAAGEPDLELMLAELKARTRLYLGDFTASEQLFDHHEQQILARMAAGDTYLRPELLSAHDYQCVLTCYQNRFDEMAVCETNLREAYDIADSAAEGWALTNLASCEMQQGKVVSALSYLEAAEGAFADAGLPSYRGSAMAWRAEAHRLLGEFRQSKQVITGALELLERGGRSFHLASAQRRAAELYLQLGDFERANYYASASTELYASDHNSELEARSRRILASTLGKTGRYEAALAELEKLEAYYSGGSGKQTELVMTRMEYAVTLQKAGRTEAALQLAEAVHSSLGQVGDRQKQAEVLLAYGTLLSDLGKPLAEHMLNAARQRFVSTKSPLGEVEADAELARYYLRAGRDQAAIEMGLAAITLLNTVTTSMEPERQGPAFRQKVFSVFGVTVRALLNADSGILSGHAGQAFDIAMLGLAQRARIQVDAADTGLVERRRQVSEAMAERLSAQKAGDTAAVDTAALRLVRALDAFEAQLSELSASTPEAPVGLDALQAGLSGGDLFVAYLFADGAGWRFEVSRDSLSAHELPGAATLVHLTQAVYEQVNSIHQVPQGLLRELGAVLLPDIAAATRRIYVLPDGPLNFVPFDMLPDPAAPRFQPLVERYIVSSLAAAPSGTQFAGSPVEIDRGIAIIANPALSTDEVPLVSVGWQGPDRQSPTLPWAEAEAKQLSTLFAPYDVTLLTGADATAAALERGDVRQRGVLHFATHGFFSSDAGMLAGLALAGVDGGEDGLPGLLTPQYARSLPLQAGLVVLNGCETSMGRSFDGQGLQGLSRAFLDNGVQHVIGTLWKVSDRAASQFVYSFYRNLLAQGGTDVALALAQTKRDFLKSPRYRNPFFWGGYVHLTLI